jgi:tetratricopeptide (TPR) repeat protein
MSPEQAEGKSAILDHRTDIYSLGITLYELLTLRPAFPAADRQAILKQITHDEPPAPRKLNKHIPADLETIVLKSISKDPRDRYASAADLSADLRRHLSRQPIKARHLSITIRGRRWLRRHPGVLASSALVLFVALVAAIVAAGIANAERAKTVEALKGKDRALTRAEQNLDLAVDTVNEMYTDLAVEWIANETAPTTMQQRFLEQAVSFYERIMKEPRTTDGQKLRASRVYAQVGRIEQYLGNSVDAAESLRESIAISEGLLEQVRDGDELQRSLAERYRALAKSLVETGDSLGADEAYRNGLAHLDRSTDEQPPSVETLEEHIEFDHGRAALFISTDQFERAEKAVASAKERIAALWKLKAIPRFLAPQNDFLAARVNLLKGESASARLQAQKALDGCRRLRVQSYRDARPALELETDITELLGQISESENELAQAAEHYRQALDLQLSAFKGNREPADFLVQANLLGQDFADGQLELAPFCRYIETQLRLARVLHRLDQWNGAEQILGECELAAPVIWSYRENVLRYYVAEANAWGMAAELLADARPAEADPARKYAIVIWQDILAKFPHAAKYRSGIHGSINDFERFRGRLSAQLADSLSPCIVPSDLRLTRPEIAFTQRARERSWQDAEQSDESRKVDRARAWLYRTMSHALLGDEDEARRWFNKAIAAIEPDDVQSVELKALRDQAEKLVGPGTQEVTSSSTEQ